MINGTIVFMLGCFVLFLFVFLQFSDDFYTFEKENITVSIGNPVVTKTFSLEKGKRKTLLIPSANIDEFVLVS